MTYWFLIWAMGIAILGCHVIGLAGQKVSDAVGDKDPGAQHTVTFCAFILAGVFLHFLAVGAMWLLGVK